METNKTNTLNKKNNKNKVKVKTMKKQKIAILVGISVLALSSLPVKAGNIIFSFSTTTGAGMDLFSTTSGALVTNSTTPSVFFSLGYVASNFDFGTATRASLVSSISYINSSASSWAATGSAQATGGKPVIAFDNGGSGYDTATLNWAGKKLVAVVSQGINPFSGGAIVDATPLAIVRSSTWANILSPDAAPSPTTMSLNVLNFDTILVGTYSANAGNVNASGTTKFDTISMAVIPEPSSASLLALGVAGLVALRVRRKS